jgi:hypothetical protein
VLDHTRVTKQQARELKALAIALDDMKSKYEHAMESYIAKTVLYDGLQATCDHLQTVLK